MERDIFLFRPLKGRYVWSAPVMYVTAVALFVGPLLSKIGVFSYTVGLLFVLLSFSIAVLFFNGGDDCLFADSALKRSQEYLFPSIVNLYCLICFSGSAPTTVTGVRQADDP